MALKTLDARGLKCPMPIVRAKKELDAMAPGDLLEVMATDPGSVADFRGWAKSNRRALLREQRHEKDESGRDVYIHVIERADG
jgi:tRNA 2-thiouridine synthesizing protein A